MVLLCFAMSAAMVQAKPAIVPPALPTEAQLRANPPKATPVAPGDAAIVAEIRALERQWGEAFVKRDFNFIERIVAPQFRLASTTPSGVFSLTSRADWMANSRAFRHVAFADEVLDVMTAGDTAVALVRTTWTVQAFADRPPQVRGGLCADTWVRRTAGWQVVYRNCNRRPIPPAPAPTAPARR